ncbi:MAG TPA: hypothetical protein PLF23_24525, partial [Candidatus Obscuribacter sp.]|nr:hypothetical protein [Candidatus Obscuribacter sp.]
MIDTDLQNSKLPFGFKPASSRQSTASNFAIFALILLSETRTWHHRITGLRTIGEASNRELVFTQHLYETWPFFR